MQLAALQPHCHLCHAAPLWRSPPRHAVRSPLTAAYSKLGAAHITAQLTPSYRPTCRGLFRLRQPRNSHLYAQQPQQEQQQLPPGSEVRHCKRDAREWAPTPATYLIAVLGRSLKTHLMKVCCAPRHHVGFAPGVSEARAAASWRAASGSHIRQVCRRQRVSPLTAGGWSGQQLAEQSVLTARALRHVQGCR
jgi:hypothetical protein